MTVGCMSGWLMELGVGRCRKRGIICQAGYHGLAMLATEMAAVWTCPQNETLGGG